MLTITKDYFFSAAHTLMYHQGKCSRLHGHNYKVEVSIKGEPSTIEDSSFGMIMDFSELDDIMKPWLDQVDHYDLNQQAVKTGSEDLESVYIRRLLPKYPTAENLALGLAKYLHHLESTKLWKGKVHNIVVWETEKARATWEREY